MINKEQIDFSGLSKEEQKKILKRTTGALWDLLLNECKLDRINYRNALIVGANLYLTSFSGIDIIEYQLKRTFLFGDRVLLIADKKVIKNKSIYWFIFKIIMNMNAKTLLNLYKNIRDSKILKHKESIDNVNIAIDTWTRYGKK